MMVWYGLVGGSSGRLLAIANFVDGVTVGWKRLVQYLYNLPDYIV